MSANTGTGSKAALANGYTMGLTNARAPMANVASAAIPAFAGQPSVSGPAQGAAPWWQASQNAQDARSAATIAALRQKQAADAAVAAQAAAVPQNNSGQDNYNSGW